MGRKMAKNLVSRVRLFRFNTQLCYASSLHLSVFICKMGVFRVIGELMPIKSKNRVWTYLST